MNLKVKFDVKSIRFRLWAYFIGFAALLIILIWILQIFFLKTYYEEMKISETTKIANEIIDSYDENHDFDALASTINTLLKSNDIFIKVETGDGDILIAPDGGGHGPMYMYSFQIAQMRSKLSSSSLSRVSEIVDGGRGERTLAYACYLYRSNSDNSSDTSMSSTYILYIFSPLSPVESTISILRSQLVYITLISIFLALALALYLASHISKPIKQITDSAAEMGRGHYGIKFQGGHFSEISELADTLTIASRELEKTDMYQKDLIANVSHDLRTPLTMIKSYAEMVRDLSGDNPTKRNAHLGVIIEEADRLNTLVTDMLNMSKMQSKKIILERNKFNLSQTTMTLLASYEILAENEGYHFKYRIEKGLMVNGDEAKIKQVMSNLINNAVKYCGKDKEINIRLRKTTKKIRFEVSDHGKGIAPDEINHVWERYYKSSTHHVRPTDGSGLGLSIVKEILTLHKADYGVESELGKGSTFWFEMNEEKPEKSRTKK